MPLIHSSNLFQSAVRGTELSRAADPTYHYCDLSSFSTPLSSSLAFGDMSRLQHDRSDRGDVNSLVAEVSQAQSSCHAAGSSVMTHHGINTAVLPYASHMRT